MDQIEIQTNFANNWYDSFKVCYCFFPLLKAYRGGVVAHLLRLRSTTIEMQIFFSRRIVCLYVYISVRWTGANKRSTKVREKDQHENEANEEKNYVHLHLYTAKTRPLSDTHAHTYFLPMVVVALIWLNRGHAAHRFFLVPGLVCLCSLRLVIHFFHSIPSSVCVYLYTFQFLPLLPTSKWDCVSNDCVCIASILSIHKYSTLEIFLWFYWIDSRTINKCL